MKRLGIVSAGMLLAATIAFAGDLPDYKSLCNAIGKIEGWSATKCEGMKMLNPMMGEVVTAQKSFKKNGKLLDLSVISGMQAMMMWAPYSAGTQIESDEALVKIEKIDGFNVGITYDKKSDSGGIVVQIAPNAVLVANFEKMSWKEALKLTEKIDWKRLKRLFGN